MSHYEVSIDGRNLRIRNPGSGTNKTLSFYATLLVEAVDPEKAESEALSRVQADPHVAAVAMEPPELSIDDVVEVTGESDTASMHGPIFCFFEAPAET